MTGGISHLDSQAGSWDLLSLDGLQDLTLELDQSFSRKLLSANLSKKIQLLLVNFNSL